MKRILIAAVLCFFLSSIGWAQQNDSDAPATKEDVENYLKAVHSHEMIQKMMDAMTQPLHKMVHEQYLKYQDKLPADFEARQDKLMDDMLLDMPWDDVMQAMVPIYQKHFTKGDINALVAFYSSPTGQKLLNEMPAVMADAMNSMMPIIQQHVEKVTQHLQDEMAAELKQSQKTPGQNPATNSATRN